MPYKFNRTDGIASLELVGTQRRVIEKVSFNLNGDTTNGDIIKYDGGKTLRLPYTLFGYDYGRATPAKLAECNMDHLRGISELTTMPLSELDDMRLSAIIYTKGQTY